MVQVLTQPLVFRRPDLPAFDGLPMIDRAFCGALRVARTLGDHYATEGMDLEEVGLAHTMENLLYTIPQKCEAALGEHPTDVASFERWSNLDMVDCLCQETRTPATFFLISLAMDASPFLSLATFPPMYCLIDPILLPSLCVHHGQFLNIGPLPDHRLIQT